MAARAPRVFVSARTGEGLALLRAQIAAAIGAAADAALNASLAAASHADAEAAEPERDGGDESLRTGTYHSHA